MWRIWDLDTELPGDTSDSYLQTQSWKTIFASLPAPGGRNISALTPWWILFYSFFHSKCWKHKIGEKAKEKIKAPQNSGKQNHNRLCRNTSEMCIFFFHQYFKCIYTTAIPSIMPIRKVWKKFSYFPCKRAWQHDSIQFCRRPRCMHREWIWLAVCIFSPHSCFSTVLLTVLNENTAKVKTPKCGGVERHIYSHMWRVRPLQLLVASHSFELQVLPLPGKDRWCIIPLQPITHSVSLTRSLCSPSARSTVAQILRTNESAEAYGFNLFTAC